MMMMILMTVMMIMIIYDQLRVGGRGVSDAGGRCQARRVRAGAVSGIRQ